MSTPRYWPFELHRIKRGDIICHRITGDSYVVDRKMGDKVIAVRIVVATDSDEWKLLNRTVGESE